MFRRLRSAMTIGALWTAVWFPVGIVVGLALGWLGIPPHGSSQWLYIALWPFLGLTSGAIFATLLATFERDRTVRDLSTGRLALWGAIGGAVVPVGVSLAVVAAVRQLHLSRQAPGVFMLMAVLGAVCAVGTLQIARRGKEQAPQQLRDI